MTLVNKVTQGSGARSHNTSSAHCVVCSPLQVKAPSITIYSPFPSSTSPRPPPAITTLLTMSIIAFSSAWTNWSEEKGYFPFFPWKKKITFKSSLSGRNKARAEKTDGVFALTYLLWESLPNSPRDPKMPVLRGHCGVCTQPSDDWLNWAGLWVPGAGAWGSFLSFDLAQHLIQRKSTLNIYVMNEWIKCLRIGMEENEGINAYWQTPMCFMESLSLSHNMHTLPELLHLLKFDRLFFMKDFHLFSQKNPHINNCWDWPVIFFFNRQHSQSLYCVK